VSRVLFLLPSVPVPMDAGAKLRNHGLLEALGAEHEVDAIAFGQADSLPDLLRLTRRARVVAEPAQRSIARRALDLGASQLPDMALRCWSPAFLAAVRSMINDGAYDAVQAEGIEMARYLDVVPAGHRIYDAHNAEFLLQRRLADGPARVPRRVYSRLQWRRLERFERRVVRRSRMTLAVSNHDANQLLALAGCEADVRVVPNAIDVSAYPFAPQRPDAQANLLFVGKLDFRPNADAVRWFIDHVLKALDGPRLFAVGAEPPAWLVAAGQHDDRIAVTGYVADDRPYLARATALILPLHTGGGSRLKALIALASGLPIVSTRVGMEGLDAEPGRHFLLAETAAEWITSVRRLLADAELRQCLARNGRLLVEQRYDWAALRPEVAAAYAWLGT
jgi:glycosyltransferase involved in cell wall biosynthesis